MLWSQEGLERLLHLLGNMEMPLGAYYTNTLPTERLTPARGIQTPAWAAGRIWDFQTKTGIK